MKKLLFVLAAVLTLSVPAFADADPSFSSTFQLTQNNAGAPWYVTTFETDSAVQGEVYFYVKVMDGNSNYRELYAISETSNARAIGTVVRVTDNNTSYTYYTCNTSSGGYYFSPRCTYWGAIDSNYVASPELSAFPSTATNAEIAAAFETFLNTPQTPPVQSSFSVPRGNVAYFQVAAAGDVNFTSYMSQLSFLVQFGENQYGPWGDTGQRYGPAAALPAAGTTFPLASQDPIRWFKDAKQNVLGQTKIGKSTKSCIVGQWYAFYNPDISQIAHEPTSDIAGASVTVQGSFSQVKVYPLSERLDYSGVGGTFSSYSDDDYASYYDGNIGEDGSITWTDQSGDVNAPSAGGQNAQYGDLSTEGLLETMRNTLNRIFEEIKSLFTFGYEAVQTLVGIFSDFVASLGQLYTWLPSEVYSALMSAVIVAIVIGVFKVFL